MVSFRKKYFHYYFWPIYFHWFWVPELVIQLFYVELFNIYMVRMNQWFFFLVLMITQENKNKKFHQYFTFIIHLWLLFFFYFTFIYINKWFGRFFVCLFVCVSVYLYFHTLIFLFFGISFFFCSKNQNLFTNSYIRMNK